MNQCGNCNYVFDSTTVPSYCPKCGASTIAEDTPKPGNKKCPKCGTANINEAKYCMDCGSDLTQLLMEG